jgi:hypothetical protein
MVVLFTLNVVSVAFITVFKLSNSVNFQTKSFHLSDDKESQLFKNEFHAAKTPGVISNNAIGVSIRILDSFLILIIFLNND